MLNSKNTKDGLIYFGIPLFIASIAAILSNFFLPIEIRSFSIGGIEMEGGGIIITAIAFFSLSWYVIHNWFQKKHKDKELEMAILKIRLEEKTLEFDRTVFEYEAEKENETKLERKIRELYVDWYQYIRYVYPEEVKGAFGEGQPFYTELITLGDRLHACYQGQLMSESNPEDVKLDKDLINLHNKTIEIAVEWSASEERVVRGYGLFNKIFPLQHEVLGKIWKKIKNPPSIYGED